MTLQVHSRGGAPSGERRRRADVDAEARARSLGWFSLGLGITQIAAPRSIDRMLGLRPDRRRVALTRAVGVRDIAAGLGILMRSWPAGWLWLRTLGDVMDLTLLGSTLRARRADRKRVAASLTSVLGVTLLDSLTAAELSLCGPRADGREDQERRPEPVSGVVTVSRPREEVYRFWRDLRNLPRFMRGIDAVETIDERRSRWTAAGPAGTTIAWDVEILDDRPGAGFAWHALEAVSGAVRFDPAPGGRGTEVRLTLEPRPRGPLGAALAKVFGPVLEHKVAADLRSFKQVMETGEVVQSDASVDRGPRAARPPAEPRCAPSNANGPNRSAQALSPPMEGGTR